MTTDVLRRTSSAPATSRRKERPWKTSATGLGIMRVGVLLGFLGLWSLAVRLELVDPILAKTPQEVWAAFSESMSAGDVWPALQATVFATLLGFVIASVVGVVIGALLALLPTVSAVLDPFLDALNAMPRVALAPVFIIYFGIGTSAKVALAFSIVVFVMIFSTRAGIRSADPEVMRLSVMLDASKLQLFWKVLLPVSVPSIFAGLRLGLVYSFLGVVTSEIIASEEGIGTLIMKYAGAFELEGVYAFLILLAVVASLFNAGMALLERRILRWQPPAVN